MRIGILSESPADDAAIRVIVDAALGRQSTPATIPGVLARSGVSTVPRILKAAIRRFHYCDEADGLVVVIDGDKSPVDGVSNPASRLAEYREHVSTVLGVIRAKGQSVKLRIAIGVAFPEIVAWYRWLKDPTRCNESAWRKRLESGESPAQYIKMLKLAKFGTLDPGPALALQKAVSNCQSNLVQLDAWAAAFPIGLGSMINEIRSWRT